MATRLPAIDAAKGIGIVLVVYGHVHLGLRSAGLVPSDSVLQLVTDAIYTFHMPLFFFLAGVFVRPSLAKGTVHFWRSKVALLLYTYVVWSLLQGGLQIAFSGVSNKPPSTSMIAGILWAPIYQFWFLYALFWCRAAFASVSSLNNIVIFAIAACGFLIKDLAGLHVLGIVLWAFFYFALGALFAARVTQPAPIPARGLVIVLAAPLVIFVTAAANPGDLGTLPAAICGIAAVLWASERLAGPLPVLVTLGRASMSIFVMHVLAAGAARAFLTHALQIENIAVHLVVGTVAGLALPLLAQAVLERLRLSAWLGLSGDIPVRRQALPAGISS